MKDAECEEVFITILSMLGVPGLYFIGGAVVQALRDLVYLFVFICTSLLLSGVPIFFHRG